MFLPDSGEKIMLVFLITGNSDHLGAFLIAQLMKKCLQCKKPRFESWVRKILQRRDRPPTAVLWPGEFHGLYSPWGSRELDMTEQLSL